MIIYISVLAFMLVVGIVLFFTVKRNYFNKYKYVRLVKYNNDMSISVSYYKRDQFNKNDAILINPDHVFDFKGYTSITITSQSSESINPLDFTSKFNKKDFETAMESKLIQETFASLKADKFDKIMMLLFLNIAQLVAISYLLYNMLGGAS
jgi:hypothetical protein